MTTARWQLPERSLRASLASTSAAGLACAIGLAMLAVVALGASPSYSVKAGTLFALVMSTAAWLIGRHHPFPRFGPANQTTTLRLAGVACVAALVGEASTPALAAAAALATAVLAVLDGLDGWLARRSGMTSAFGARFDMETDAILILALSVLAWQHGKAGAWVLASGLVRYLFVAAGVAAPWLAQPLPPSRRRQTICVVQVAALAVVIAPWIDARASAAIAAVALAALTGSFLIDVAWLWRVKPTTAGVRAFPSWS
jgi:phosphatidylglycerophosphate synthase